MLGPYDYNVRASNPHDHEDNCLVIPTGWVLSGNSDIMQDRNPHLICYGEPCAPEQPADTSCSYDWDIKDVLLPRIEFHDKFELWPNGDCRFIYSANNVKAQKHKCGWAMRNTNNHNKIILKKSCLGVIKCSKSCLYPDSNSRLSLAPKISEGARRCQLNNKCCPNPDCGGVLIQQPCKGKSGNPVTHYWRYSPATNSIYFMAKGVHDHSRPVSLLKITDRKIRLIKRDTDDDEKQVIYPSDDRGLAKRGALDINMNIWNKTRIVLPNDYDAPCMVTSQGPSLDWCHSHDPGNTDIDRQLQQYHANIQYPKQEYPPNNFYHSPDQNMIPATSNFSPAFLSEFTDDSFSSLPAKSYPFFSLKTEVKDQREVSKEDLETQWTANYGNCDIHSLPCVNYDMRVIDDDDDLKSRFHLNDEYKMFDFFTE